MLVTCLFAICLFSVNIVATVQQPPPWHRALEKRFNRLERNLADEKNELWKEIYSISVKVDEYIADITNRSVECKDSQVVTAEESANREHKMETDNGDVDALLNGLKDEKKLVREFTTKSEQQRKRTQEDLHGRMESMDKRMSEEIIEVKNYVSSQLADFWNNTLQFKETKENLESMVKQLQSEMSGLKEEMTKLQPTCGSWHAFKGSCYFVSDKLLTWEDARDSCQADGAYLAEVESAEEAGFLIDLAKSARNVKGSYGPWLGASDTDSDGDWVWQLSGRHINKGFSDWVLHEPNGKTSENCLHMSSGIHLFHWNDTSCTLKTNFICEK